MFYSMPIDQVSKLRKVKTDDYKLGQILKSEQVVDGWSITQWMMIFRSRLLNFCPHLKQVGGRLKLVQPM